MRHHQPKSSQLSRPVKLAREVIARAPGLLPMWYKPAELAEDLGIPYRTLLDWLWAGAPHRRDDGGRLWINGEAFFAWITAVRQQRRERPRLSLAAGEAWCFRCQRAVPLLNPARRRQGRQVLLSGVCPECGTAICRGGRLD